MLLSVKLNHMNCITLLVTLKNINSMIKFPERVFFCLFISMFSRPSGILWIKRSYDDYCNSWKEQTASQSSLLELHKWQWNESHHHRKSNLRLFFPFRTSCGMVACGGRDSRITTQKQIRLLETRLLKIGSHWLKWTMRIRGMAAAGFIFSQSNESQQVRRKGRPIVLKSLMGIELSTVLISQWNAFRVALIRKWRKLNAWTGRMGLFLGNQIPKEPIQYHEQ